MKYPMILSVLMCPVMGCADDIVDVHGLEAKQAQKVLQVYAPRVRRLEMGLMREVVNMNLGKPHLNPKRYQQLISQKKRLIAEIKQAGHFAFVDLQTVYYSKADPIYTTIEIIPHRTSTRMHFLSQSPLTDKKHHDVIEQMRQYIALSMHLLLTQQLDGQDKECPFYHCVEPFHHPQLKPYLALFRQGVLEKKQSILDTLAQDPNPERRAAAAFLIGFFPSPYDIITQLSAHVGDPDYEVRNSVLRVIGATLDKAHLTQMDPKPFIALLDSPYVTDRNKALQILHTLANSQQAQKIICQQGGQQLLRLLQLTQPNNHHLAYLILKKISHAHFGDQQFVQWKSWMLQHQERYDETPVSR